MYKIFALVTNQIKSKFLGVSVQNSSQFYVEKVDLKSKSLDAWQSLVYKQFQLQMNEILEIFPLDLVKYFRKSYFYLHTIFIFLLRVRQNINNMIERKSNCYHNLNL